jgi:hypothetical protein
MRQLSRSEWIVIGIAALLLVVVAGDPVHWPLVVSNPERIAETRLTALTVTDIQARTQPMPIHEQRLMVRHQLTEEAALQIAAARRHIGLTLAGIAGLGLLWRQGRRRSN